MFTKCVNTKNKCCDSKISINSQIEKLDAKRLDLGMHWNEFGGSQKCQFKYKKIAMIFQSIIDDSYLQVYQTIPINLSLQAILLWLLLIFLVSKLSLCQNYSGFSTIVASRHWWVKTFSSVFGKSITCLDPTILSLLCHDLEVMGM